MLHKPSGTSAAVYRTEPPRQLASNHDETALMRAACDDVACFETLYRAYFPRVYAYCLSRVGSAEEAEDLTSLIFTEVLNGLPRYRGGSVPAWIFRIARNTLADYYQQRRRAPLPLDVDTFDMIDESHSPGERVMQTERQHMLQQLIATLPDHELEVLALRIDAGLTAEEIGTLIGKRAGAVRTMLHRILKRLRARCPAELRETL
jgi:RNA polymerase sigma-70 factor (ECF subfamily)